MKIFNKITSFILAGILLISLSVSSFAETANTEAVTASASAYVPADVTDYEKWDGRSAIVKGKKYYIDSAVKVGKDELLNIPSETELIVRDGGNLMVYLGAKLMVGGQIIVEPGGKLTASSETLIHTNGKLICYGTATFTKSAVMSLSSELRVEPEGVMVFAGTFDVYKSGVFHNYGRVSFAETSNTKVTGHLNTYAGSQTFVKGAFAVTLSGELDLNGYFSLADSISNSGTITLEKSVNLYKALERDIILTNSGRIVDKRSDDTADENIEPVPDTKPDDDPAQGERLQIKGIDVSRYNGSIDWKKVKESGIEFAIIRSSIGLESETYGQDRRFAYNASEAYKAGLKVGAYHYLKATSVSEARKEAKFFVEVIKPYTLEYPVLLDFEDPAQEHLSKSTLTEMAKVFMDEVKAAGYYPMLYTYRNWIRDRMDMTKIADYDVAVAEWTDKPSYTGNNFGIWQYTSNGHVSGISGEVDLDICYKDYAKIIKDGGYNNLVEK